VIGNNCSIANGLIAALFYSVFQPGASFNSLAFNGEGYEPGTVWGWQSDGRSSQIGDQSCWGRRVPRRGLPAQTARRHSSSPPGTIYFSRAIELPQLTRNEFDHSGTILTADLAAVGLVTIVLWKQGILREVLLAMPIMTFRFFGEGTCYVGHLGTCCLW